MELSHNVCVAMARRELDDYYSSEPYPYPSGVSDAAAVVGSKESAGLNSVGRKAVLYDAASRLCAVKVFTYYPFYFELAAGRPRNAWFGSVLTRSYIAAGRTDVSPAREYERKYRAAYLLACNDFTDFDHRSAGYDNLLKYGLRGIYERCGVLNRTETDGIRREWRECVMTACLSLKRAAERMSGEAKRMLDELCGERGSADAAAYAAENLKRIAECAAKVPWEPPATFYEALNTILFFREITNSLEGTGISTYGHLDRMLAPYYENDLAAGRITADGAYRLIALFCAYTDSRFRYVKNGGLETSTTIMIGGQDASGVPVYNAVTRMILRAYKENSLINPKLNARACLSGCGQYLADIADALNTGANYIAVENDEANVPILMRHGMTAEDARLYVGCGCQEITAQNTASHSRAFIYVNLPLILLDTLYGRNRELYGIGEADGHNETYETFDAVIAAFFRSLKYVLKKTAEAFAPYDELQYDYLPEPLLSCTMDDCVEQGLDMTRGGTRYNHKTFSLAGFGTLADSLLSIKKFVFDDKTVTLGQLLSLCENNFADGEALRRRLLESGCRYGRGDADASEFAASLAHGLAHIADDITGGRGLRYGVSLFIYYMFKNFGDKTPATPDGRLAGEPFSRGYGPYGRAALTEEVLSVSALDMTEFTDTAVLDIMLPYAENGVGTAALAGFIGTCVKCKIPVIQICATDRKSLVEERDFPGTHPELVVRVCGYSARFSCLSRPVQNEIISRETPAF